MPAMVLNVHQFGPDDGRPLVPLHGLMGHGRRWRSLAVEELPAFRVCAPDLRGHGLSIQGPPWTLEQHAADVLATMDHLGIEHATVMGQSLGAVVALYVARLAPERVESLILLDPAMQLPIRLADELAHESLHVPAFDTPEEAAAERARTWPPQAEGLVDEELEAHLVRGEDGRWRWRYSAPACVTTYSELARPAVTPPMGIPTLLVVAARSRAVSPAYVESCRSALGDQLTVARLECGHQIYLEQATELGRLIRQFMAGGR